MLRLSIASDPPLHLYAHPDALASIPAGELCAQILIGISPVDASIEDMNPDQQVTIENSSGQAAELLFRAPPVDMPATLYDGSIVLFAGVVDSITLGAVCTMRVQA